MIEEREERIGEDRRRGRRRGRSKVASKGALLSTCKQPSSSSTARMHAPLHGSSSLHIISMRSGPYMWPL